MSRLLTHATRIAVATSVGLVLAGCAGVPSHTAGTPEPSSPEAATTRLAIIGDFGSGDSNEASVAKLVARSDPEWVVSLGDNVYSAAGYPALVGAYYAQYVEDNKFIPTTGNHDYENGIAAYDKYFGLSAQPRYFARVVNDDLTVFVLDSEAALNSTASLGQQKAWLTKAAADSTAKFKVVVLHHPPFTSGTKHGPSREFQWDFASMGVSLVMAGHEHIYERIVNNAVTYVVDGTGGRNLYSCGAPAPGEQICRDDSFGALFLSQTREKLSGTFVAADGKMLDEFEILPR
jgi:tartrate-resistant acid phosphatase type 5